MKTENSVLMKMGLDSLKGKWGLAIGTFVVYILIICSIQIVSRFSPIFGILSLIIAGPLCLGVSIFSLALSRGQNATFEQLFKGFNNFGISLGAYILMIIFVALWALLLIIPGLIAAISYSMTFYIIADDNTIGAMEAIDKSKTMMEGYKWKYFTLFLRFFGWAILCILSLGIGFLWLFPYMQISMAKFYDDIKSDNLITEIA